MQVGDKVRLLKDLFDIHIGMLGTITEDYGTGFMVKWDERSYSDGFNKEDELHMLELVK